MIRLRFTISLALALAASATLYADDPAATPFDAPDDPDLIPIEVATKAYEVLDNEAMRTAVMETPVYNRGMERVPFALFSLDSARPMDRFEFRTDLAYNWHRPDRSEYLWAEFGGKGPPNIVGPGIDPTTDLQEFTFIMEKATGFASALVEIPIRVLDPSITGDPFTHDNTAGLSDIRVGVKTRLFEFDDAELSMIFRTFIPSGLASRGLGTGHVSMEPGVLANYRVNDETFLHGEIKFRFPIAGSQGFAGNVIQYGFGISHVLYSQSLFEGCPKYFAVIPTFEIVAWNALDGLETARSGFVQNVDGFGIVNLQPGLRVVLTERIEVGYSAAINVSEYRWYETLHQLSIRWYY